MREAQPSARRDAVVEELHGHRVEDPYRWLESADDPACQEWLAGQERWLAAQAGTWETRPVFRSLMRRFLQAGNAAVPAVSPPVCRGERRFFLRRGAEHEHPVLVAATAGRGERVVVDPVALDPSGRTALDAWRPSWSGRLLAYQVSAHGSEAPVLTVVDVADGRRVGPPVRPGRGTAVAWLPDDSGFYYVTCPAEGDRQVRLRLLDSPREPGEDPVVFTTGARQLSVSVGADGRWLTVSCAPGAQCGNQVHLADLTAAPAHAPGLRPVHDGTATGVQALVKSGPRGLLYAITTEGAPGGRVCRVDPARPHAAAWTPLITPDPDTVLSACAALVEPGTGATRFLVSSARRGVAGLSLHDGDGRPLADIETPGTGCGTIMKLTVPPGEPDRAWFTYTDFVTAPAVHRFDLGDRRCRLDTPSPADRDPAESSRCGRPPAVVRQVTYFSEDGTEVPLFLVTPADGALGPRPTLLTAYGGFGATAAPAYSPTILSWVAAGGAYAIAGVRGGGELGATWHAAGRGVNKPTAFADYAAAARWLIAEGVTTPARLAVKGASHSGLMAAVAITRNPGLYAAAVCSGAPADMVRYPRLGLGRWWIDEFGDPDDPGHLAVLLGYSPYHRVRPGTPYPAVLLITGRTDPRVDAAHTRKFTAALQHATGSGAPVVLRCEDGVGHGPRTVSGWIDTEADALAFLAAHTGLRPSPGPGEPGEPGPPASASSPSARCPSAPASPTRAAPRSP
ncbi:prolyl oligopeptidase family serine peptidase [Streptomyces sp. NPDC052701]|uniref:prolyl oligopeptidase family serine peptidase n=1 Tax=Streptomyces sp. NPDC052701 TaxID=3155533 RepID=UPI00344AB0D9